MFASAHTPCELGAQCGVQTNGQHDDGGPLDGVNAHELVQLKEPNGYNGYQPTLGVNPDWMHRPRPV
jgi:hypothetical protein